MGSAVSLFGRWKLHTKAAFLGKQSKKFQNAIDKYGWENFEFLILEYCSKCELVDREQYWINWLNSFKDGYNTRSIAESNIGILISDENKKKLSVSKKGKQLSAEIRQKMSRSGKGRKFSEEHKRKIGEANRRRVLSRETRAKISESKKGKLIGKTLSEEHKLKIKLALTGKRRGPMPENFKTKISLALKGKTLTEEHKRKIGESHKKRKS